MMYSSVFDNSTKWVRGDDWVLIATCKQLVWSNRIGWNMPIWNLCLRIRTGAVNPHWGWSMVIGTWGSPILDVQRRLRPSVDIPTLRTWPPSLEFRVPYTCAHVPYTYTHATIRVYDVRAHGQFSLPKMTLLYMVYDVHSHRQFCRPQMVLLYNQTLPLLPEEGSELYV
jgi:hypothetical protein